MAKQRIRLSEATLHNIIRKCVNEAVRQMPKNRLRRRTIKKRVNESSMQQNIVVDGEKISFKELQRIAKWCDGLQDEDFVVEYDGEEIPISASAHIDLDNPSESTFYLNDSEMGDSIDGVYSDTPLGELIEIYHMYSDDGRYDINSALSCYLNDVMR